MNNNRQKSIDILQYNQQQVQNNIQKKKQDVRILINFNKSLFYLIKQKLRQQEEERAYLDRINLELNQEKSSQIMKKQAIIDQSQRDYASFMNRQTDSAKTEINVGGLRKKNSKLMEINTFKIGGENREIAKKMKYNDYNENLNLNPTKNYIAPGYVNPNVNLNPNPGASNFNIINHSNQKQFNENPLKHTSNEYKIMNNNDNFDSYGRQIGVQQINVQGGSQLPPDYNQNQFERGMGGAPNMMGIPEPQIQEVKGIENLENYSPYNDHFNYRPVSGVNSVSNNSQVQGQAKKPITPYSNVNQGGYIQEKKLGGIQNQNQILNNNNQINNQKEIEQRQMQMQQYQQQQQQLGENPYENYRIEPMNQQQGKLGNPMMQPTNQNQQRISDSQPQQPRSQPQSEPQKKKVDLNTLPIPDNVNTVEDYEQYLLSLGIDPLTLEYIDDGSQSLQNQSNPVQVQSNNPPNSFNELAELEGRMQGMNISENPNLNPNYNYNIQNPNQIQQQQQNLYQQNQNSNSLPPRKDIDRIKQDYTGYNNYGGQIPQQQERKQQQLTSNSSYGKNKNSNTKDLDNKAIQLNNNSSYENPLNNNLKKEPYLPNYGAKPTYKNQSSILIADASAHSAKGAVPQFEKKDYEPFIKNKPLVINPCK